MQLVSDLEPFKSAKLATKFKHIPTGKVYLLRRVTDNNNKGTLYLWNKDTEDQHFGIYPEQWEQIVRPDIDAQAALKQLLDCIHDGERIEILEAMDQLHNHIRYMGTLPVISKDYSDNHHSLWVLNVEVNDISS